MQIVIQYLYFFEMADLAERLSGCGELDQLANLHFRYTSVPRYTPMVQRNADGDTPSSGETVTEVKKTCKRMKSAVAVI